jgi:hypothetical protein
LQHQQKDLVIQLGFIALSAWLGFEATLRMSKKWPDQTLLIWIYGTAGMAIAPFLLNHFLFGQSLATSPLMITLYFAWLAAINLVGSLLRAFVQNPEATHKTLIRDISDEAVMKIANEITEFKSAQYLADFIHGRIQSRLMASLLLIDTPGLTNQDLANELKDLHRIVMSHESHPYRQTLESSEMRLAQIVATWEGLLKVHGVDSLSPRPLSPETLSAIEEALLNASRHGHAENIWLAMTTENVLEITDDGFGPQTKSRGLGSSIYDRAASTWQLTRGNDGVGSILKLELR